MLKQINVNIDKELFEKLDELKKKTRIPKRYLIEVALRLLIVKYRCEFKVPRRSGIPNP